VLAVVCDGTGFGDDGTIWGGELLLADLHGYRRLGHLRQLRLPGGDASARDPRRCAMSLLHQTLGDRFDESESAQRVMPDPQDRHFVAQMLRGNVNCALSSGAGRVFDGVSALLGVCTTNSFEAQAAMALEAVASEQTPANDATMLAAIIDGPVEQLDLAPLITALLRRRDEPVATLAAMFHRQFALGWSRLVQNAAARTGVSQVALSGGVFCNAILTKQLTELLRARGLTVYRHRLVPPNDGGLSLGQAAIASARSPHGQKGLVRDVLGRTRTTAGV
jgi:hydrogenase maturation protein HypF